LFTFIIKMSIKRTRFYGGVPQNEKSFVLRSPKSIKCKFDELCKNPLFCCEVCLEYFTKDTPNVRFMQCDCNRSVFVHCDCAYELLNDLCFDCGKNFIFLGCINRSFESEK